MQNDEVLIAVAYAICIADENEPDVHEKYILHAKAAISAYRTHTLSGAGEVERKLRSEIVPGRASRNEAADLIAAQRERIAELKAALKPLAEIDIFQITDTGAWTFDWKEQHISVADVQRARAALGNKP